MKLKNRIDYKKRRHLRLRHKVCGTAGRPRMSVCMTGRHVYIQFIDDERAVTLAAVSTANADGKSKLDMAVAMEIGRKAAEAALSKGIKQVVFDRGGKAYHGKVKAIADAAREAGMKL